MPRSPDPPHYPTTQRPRPAASSSRRSSTSATGSCSRRRSIASGNTTRSGLRPRQEVRRTRFLANWLVAMSRRRGGKILRPRINRDEALRAKINHLGLPQASRQEISQDLHLIEAALAFDSIVVSRDDSVRSLLRSVTGTCPEFAKVVWCNPVDLGEEGLEWLRTGARAVKAWQLGSRR
jgi:hypothetical protein